MFFSYFLMYLLVALAGIFVLLDPPRSVAAIIGPLGSIAWGAFCLIGGALGAGIVFTGRWWIERIACALSVTGLAFYASTVFTLHFAQEGSRIPQFLVICGLIVAFALRYVRLRGALIEPGK